MQAKFNSSHLLLKDYIWFSVVPIEKEAFGSLLTTVDYIYIYIYIYVCVLVSSINSCFMMKMIIHLFICGK